MRRTLYTPKTQKFPELPSIQNQNHQKLKKHKSVDFQISKKQKKKFF